MREGRAEEGIELGIVGLGQIGRSLALQALEAGMSVMGSDVQGAGEDLLEAGLVEVSELDGFEQLTPPRVVLVYVPAGPAVDEVLEGLEAALEPGDVVVDGGNSYWGDSRRRHERLAERGLHFVDLGTSGGVEGARHGACFMAGGEEEPVRLVRPILEALAVEGGWVHAGPPGAGHYVKLVHNGIEFGMLQAIAEGVDLLESHPDGEDLDVVGTLACWRHGSVIRSWLVDLMERSYREHGGMEEIPPYVEDTGEVRWLVGDAMRAEVPVPVIAQAVMQLFQSRDDEQGWARAVAMMRHEFGGHPFGPDEDIAEERHKGRVGEKEAS